jgi:hypothetical protein
MAQESTELLGDDSVGWWLPLYAGFRIPFGVRGRLYQQLDRVMPTVEIGKSTLYTATSVARTLARSGLLTAQSKVASRFRDVFNDYMTKTGTTSGLGNVSPDIIWLVQALFELDELSSHEMMAKLHDLVTSDPEGDVLKLSMLWPAASKLLAPKQLDGIGTSLDTRLRTLIMPQLMGGRLHWELSYILLIFISRGMQQQAKQVAEYLVDHQSSAQWDESTDENIESTSLVGLALCSYWKFAHVPRLTVDVESFGEHFLRVALKEATEHEDTVEDRWEELRTVLSSRNKGEAFERFITFYASADPSLHISGVNDRTSSEEIDLILRNDGTRLHGKVILIECKFTTKKTEASEVRNFWTKVHSRKGMLCNLGVVVSIAGFSRDATTELFRLNAGGEDVVVAAVTGEDLELAIRKGQTFSEVLEAAVMSAIKK